ncbi:protein translocase subunit SecF [Corynebacterium sp. B5-R-101]|uniref:Protein-export membrane protein SecF n=1 Tax=Corynebacterium intestinale TaxID=2943492 RepID=A0ABT0TCI5_9CORY|nr:protein translocase subunit SecF [Corynebacterium intestinale]MCL8494690.1 protein translocase subunit SecF [Corynebacterium intestinale]MCP1390926.1 protein translocase subunit SecF [Corynebacterium intestinale]
MAVENTNRKISRFDRLYVDGSGFDFVGRAKTWYTIAGVLLIASILAIALRGFNLSLDFEGGTKLNMPAGDLSTEQVEETFTEATGVTPELVQIVGAGSSETLEITSERLTQDEVNQARQAIFEKYQVKDDNGKPSPDAIGSSTVSESWGSSITKRMVIAMAVFLVLATIYVAVRLQRDMAFAAILALIFDGVFIAGIYALFGIEVSPAVIIGLLTVLTFSLYDSVIVFDKVDENTTGLEGQRKKTYGELTNLAINQTVMRSISTSIISALPIIALFVVAVWLMGIGTLRDLALVQFIGVIEGVFSSIFLATTLLVTLSNQRKSVKKHNAVVAAYRAEGAPTEAGEGDEEPKATRTVVSPSAASHSEPEPPTGESGGASWRPGR